MHSNWYSNWYSNCHCHSDCHFNVVNVVVHVDLRILEGYLGDACRDTYRGACTGTIGSGLMLRLLLPKCVLTTGGALVILLAACPLGGPDTIMISITQVGIGLNHYRYAKK